MNFKQAEQTYYLLKQYYIDTINKAISEHGHIVLERKLNKNERYFYTTLWRDKFRVLRKVAKQINEMRD